MRRRTPFAVALVLLLVAGCSGNDTSDESTPQSSTTLAEETSETAAGNPFVQDMWIYERLRTVNSQGEIVDHTDSVIDAVAQFDVDDPIELIPGMNFAPVDLGAHLKGPDGAPRPDAGAIAGIVENEIGTAFAVLGTVDADGERQIGPDDRVFVDMSFLGDDIGLGDVVSADLTLVQFMPTDDAVEMALDAVGLAAHRAGEESLQYTADADGDVVVLTEQLGRIVAGSEGPELPVKSSDKMSDGFREGLRKCRATGLKCVSGFFSKFGPGATDNFEQNMDQLEPDPPVDPPPPVCAVPPCGKTTGDPHLTTFDGHDYGMHAVGEFVLARHDEGRVEIQIRTSAVNEQVSQVDRVAIRVGDELIVVGADDLIVDGQEFEVDRPATFDGANFTLTQLPRSTTIETMAGHLVTLHRASRGHIDVVVAADSADGGWVGLLGDADGDMVNDFVTDDGQVLSTDIGFDDLYEIFVMSWRLTDENSLFDYGDGEDTQTHTDLSYPRSPVSIDDLDDGERRMAEAVCHLAGIESPTALEQCIIDFAATGDIGFLHSALLSQAVEEAMYADGGGGDTASARTAWQVSGENLLGIDGQLGTATHDCPPMPADEVFQPWGDGVYHGGSSGVCAAAVHSGAIEAATGGSVMVTRQMAEPGVTYESVERNGISSFTWGGNSWGFVVEAADASADG